MKWIWLHTRPPGERVRPHAEHLIGRLVRPSLLGLHGQEQPVLVQGWIVVQLGLLTAGQLGNPDGREAESLHHYGHQGLRRAGPSPVRRHVGGEAMATLQADLSERNGT